MKNKVNIRFQGFTTDWEQRKFSELVNRVSSSSEDASLPRIEFEDIIAGSGVLNKDVFQKESSKRGIEFKSGDTLFGKLRPYLKNWLLPKFNGIAVGDFWVFRPKDVDSKFIYALMQSSKYQKAANLSTGTKMPRSDWGIVSNTEFKVPLNTEEQTNIGTFFERLDKSIVLQQQELAILKQTKQGFLQKMFPKDGVSLPEVRFPGFTEDWEQCRFEKVFDVHTDFVSNGSFQSLKDNVKLYHTENYAYMIRLTDASNNWKGPWLYTDKKGFEFLDKSTVYENDILMSDRGTIGKFFLVPKLGKPMTLSSNAVLLRSSKNDNSFTYYLLNTKEVGNQIKMRTTPGVQPMISKTEFKQITAKFPGLSEQKKIGSFFKQLDDTITLHQQALDLLKETKKAFLQKMFI